MTRAAGHRWRGVPTAVAAAALLCLAAVELLPGQNPGRVLGGVLIVLVLPGASLLGALAPSSAPRGWERLVWQMGLSVAVTILVTGSLAALGIRLDLGAWASALTAVSIGACGIWVLRGGQPVSFRGRALWSSYRRPTSMWMWLALALTLLTAGVLITARSATRASARVTFTQLWALPASSGSGSAVIGVYNHEGHAQSYTIDIWRGRHQLLGAFSIDLASGKSWTWHRTVGTVPGRVRVILRRGAGAGPVYREVYFSTS